MVEISAVTENISKSGAAVYCESEVVVGDMVNFPVPNTSLNPTRLCETVRVWEIPLRKSTSNFWKMNFR